MNMDHQMPRLLDGNRLLVDGQVFDSHTVEAQLAVLIDKDNAPDTVVFRDMNEKVVISNGKIYRGDECDSLIIYNKQEKRNEKF